MNLLNYLQLLTIIKMNNYAKTIGLSENEIDKGKRIIEQQLAKLDEEYRTVDGIIFETRAKADLARVELVKINEIIQTVQSSPSDPTLAYEEYIIGKRNEVNAFITEVKNKYIELLNKHLVDFDNKFRTVSFMNIVSTREEAVRKKALNIAKKQVYKSLDDIIQIKENLQEYAILRGVKFEELIEVNDYLNEKENFLKTGKKKLSKTQNNILIIGIVAAVIILPKLFNTDTADDVVVNLYVIISILPYLIGAFVIYKICRSYINKKDSVDEIEGNEASTKGDNQEKK